MAKRSLAAMLTSDLIDFRLRSTRDGLRALELHVPMPADPMTTLRLQAPLALVLDKSGSMAGPRRANLVAGLRALLQLMADDEELTLIVFDDRAHTLFSGTAQAARAAGLETRIVTGGGTRITAALEQIPPDAVALLLTDGEDAELAARVRGPDTLLDRVPAGTLHLVGICAEADSITLDRLAKRVHGTYVCIRDADIQGLMGSLLGLVREQVPHKAVLRFAEPRPITLRYGRTLLVPLAEGDDQDVQLELPSIDVRLSARPVADDDCWDVALAHARQWRGEAYEAIAGLMSDPNAEEDAPMAVLRALAARIETRWPDEPRMRPLLAEIEADQQAMGDAARARELSGRLASQASTARNSGVSLSMDDESPMQAAMRTASLAF
jgi:hypothetical protein